MECWRFSWAGAGARPEPDPLLGQEAVPADAGSSACPPGERRRPCPGRGASRGFWCRAAVVACLIARWLPDIALPHWPECGRAH
jgi:hypothetical protein